MKTVKSFNSYSFGLGFALCSALAFIIGSASAVQHEGHDHQHGHDHNHDHAHQGHDHKGQAQQGQMPQGMTAEQMKKMMEYQKLATPGSHHKELEYFVGTWNVTSKIYAMGPENPPMTSTGTSKVKWVLDKRYVMENFKGSMMGQPYEGLGMTGYDNFRNLYVGSWCSSMDTQFLTMKGQKNPETGKMVMYGEMDEPGLVTGRYCKYVTTIIDEDHYKFEIIDLHAGDDYRVIELDYTRIEKG